MISGHFATALLAKQRYPKGSLAFFLIMSQFQDFIWFLFHYLDLEPTTPTDVFDATISNMSVVMMYSHHAIPQVVWAVLAFLIGTFLYRSTQIGWVALALCIGHLILDVFSGHAHHVFGQDTPQISLGLYATEIYLALFIEALFVGLVLGYYFKIEAKQGITRTVKNKVLVIGIFIYGLIFILSVAHVSFRELFGIPPLDFGFGTTIPLIIITYVTMSLLLIYAVPQQQDQKQLII